jgi:hypothetical protein
MADPVETYLQSHKEKLAALKMMWEDTRVQLYNDQELPSEEELATGSVFLAGPTSRNQILEYNWRCQAYILLRMFGFKGWIYAPEPRGQGLPHEYSNTDSYICPWESRRLLTARKVLFWIPRDDRELLGIGTNFELALILAREVLAPSSEHQVFIGWPETAKHVSIPNHYRAMFEIKALYSRLEDLCRAVADVKQVCH